jgi:hypothetical protein
MGGIFSDCFNGDKRPDRTTRLKGLSDKACRTMSRETARILAPPLSGPGERADNFLIADPTGCAARENNECLDLRDGRPRLYFLSSDGIGIPRELESGTCTAQSAVDRMPERPLPVGSLVHRYRRSVRRRRERRGRRPCNAPNARHAPSGPVNREAKHFGTAVTGRLGTA